MNSFVQRMTWPKRDQSSAVGAGPEQVAGDFELGGGRRGPSAI